MYMPGLAYTEAFSPQLCILGDWDVLSGETLLRLVDACHLYNYDIYQSIIY
jgi:hypothetical protein